MITKLYDDLYQIDTLLGGWESVTAGYLFLAEEPVLVETGSQSSAEIVRKILKEEIGLEAEDLRAIAVTHIHLDHAGGVGDLAAAFPSATVYVHPKGARHLENPERLIMSASMVYGEFLDRLYGRLNPTEASRIKVLYDGDEVSLGSRALKVIDSPGHAKHHVAFYDEASGLLLAGDSLGVLLPDAGELRPSSPPADFDLDQALDSIGKYAAIKPGRIALAHYGVVEEEPQAFLERAREVLMAWAGVAEEAFKKGEDIVRALTERFGSRPEGVDPEKAEKLELLNGIHSNAMGLKLWLERKYAARDEGAKEPS